MSGAPRIGGNMGDNWETMGALRELEHLRSLLHETSDDNARLRGRIDKLLASPRRCDDCPGGDDYKTELERLREENEYLQEENTRGNKEWDRLHRIEEAARVFVDNQPGVRLAPEFEQAWFDLRAALEEK